MLNVNNSQVLLNSENSDYDILKVPPQSAAPRYNTQDREALKNIEIN